MMQALPRAPFVRASLLLHAVALALVGASPRTWPVALGGVLVDHALLVAASLWPRSSLVGPNLRRLPPNAGRNVALTFDDGPDPVVTPVVLDCLDAAAARATFFCIGRRAEGYPDVVAEIRRRGHVVANHTYAHSSGFCVLGPRAIARDLARAQEALREPGGAVPRYFRAPAGLRNPWLDPVLVAQGLSLVSWTRRGFDTVSRDPRAIASRLTRGLEAGDVLVLHDGASARDRAGRPVVLEALPPVLDELLRRGLRSVALSPAGSAHGA